MCVKCVKNVKERVSPTATFDRVSCEWQSLLLCLQKSSQLIKEEKYPVADFVQCSCGMSRNLVHISTLAWAVNEAFVNLCSMGITWSLMLIFVQSQQTFRDFLNWIWLWIIQTHVISMFWWPPKTKLWLFPTLISDGGVSSQLASCETCF